MGVKLNIPLPSKGLTVDRPGEYIDSRSSASVQNMEINRAIIRKRFGTTSIGSSLAERIQRYFELQVGSSTRLFRIGITKVEVLNKATSVWSSVTATPLTGAADNQISYAFPLLSGTKIAVYTNGLDVIRKCSISGNDAALGGSPPKAKYVIAYGPYLLLGHVTDGGNLYPARVQWPDTGAPETWTGGNAGSVDLIDDPEDITGFGLFGGLVTVHKTSSIYVGQLVSTSDVFRFERRATGVGTCAEATIQSLPTGEQIFLAKDGIHLFNGVTAPLIDSPINDELREEMNPAFLYKAQSVFVRELDEYWVCIAMGSDTEPQTVYKYNYRSKQIYKDNRANLTALGLFINTAESTWDSRSGTWDSQSGNWDAIENASLAPVVILGVSSGVSSERTADSTNDVTVAVSSYFDTKDFTAEDVGLPDIDRIIRWKGIELWAKGTAISVYYSLDGGTTFTLIDTYTLSSDYPDDDAPINVWFDAVKSRIRFRFLNSSSEGSFTVKKYQVEATPREARK